MRQRKNLTSHISILKSLNKERLPLFGGRRSFGFYVFTPYDYLPPGFMPVVAVVVIMVLLLIIYNACKVSRLFFNKQMEFVFIFIYPHTIPA